MGSYISVFEGLAVAYLPPLCWETAKPHGQRRASAFIYADVSCLARGSCCIQENPNYG